MPGGLAQIAAVGTADQYLVANPQITMFKQIWRRYTNFALESISQTWTGDCDFGKKCTVVLAKSGDLVSDVWVQMSLPDLADINHINGAGRLPGAPVITKARSTTQAAILVEAYGCEVLNYILSLRSDNSAVTGVAMAGASGLVLTLASAPTTVTLVPLSGTGMATLECDVSGSTATVPDATLVAGVAYGVCVNGSTATMKNHVVQRFTAQSTSQDPVFTVSGVDPAVPIYRAKVLALVSSATVASVQASVMKAKWCNSVGHALVSAVEWEMGGSRIDRHTGEHWDMWTELSEKAEKREGYSAMIGRYDAYDINYDATSSGGARTLFVPLRFSFNQSPGSALPLVALQFHDCRLNFEFRLFSELIRTNVPAVERLYIPVEPTLDSTVFATYVFLSQEERSRFAQMPHEYLIEQLQTQVEAVPSFESVNGTLTRKFTLTLNHPVKEIVWAFQAWDTYQRDSAVGNDWFNYNIPGRETEEIFQTAKIQMNGHDRFTERPAQYFRLVQPWTHHSRVPTKKVHAYSFALHPEAWTPSGAANFSRIDSAQLYMQFNPRIPAGSLRIHALGYNVLRIANGLSGIVFAS